LDGIDRIESFGVNKGITAGGMYPAEGLRMVDTASEQVPWLTTPGYYNHSFLWSPDNRYEGINFETRISGGTFIVDTQNMSFSQLKEILHKCEVSLEKVVKSKCTSQKH
jgi:hypothetical protein